MTPLIAEMVKLTPDAELYHWFDVGHIEPGQMVNLDVVNDTPLPYARCAVVGHDGPAKWLLVLRQKSDAVAVIGWLLHAGHYDRHPPFTYVRTAQGLGVFGLDEEIKATDESVRGVLAAVGAWLQALAPGQAAYLPQPRKSLINSKRAAKGLGPVLFDWHTVTIEPPKPKAQSQGGTHASPRLHDRRGHWRRYPSGKVGWVRECKVGNPAKGAVFKDYRIKDAR